MCCTLLRDRLTFIPTVPSNDVDIRTEEIVGLPCCVRFPGVADPW